MTSDRQVAGVSPQLPRHFAVKLVKSCEIWTDLEGTMMAIATAGLRQHSVDHCGPVDLLELCGKSIGK